MSDKIVLFPITKSKSHRRELREVKDAFAKIHDPILRSAIIEIVRKVASHQERGGDILSFPLKDE